MSMAAVLNTSLDTQAMASATAATMVNMNDVLLEKRAYEDRLL